MRPDPAVAWHAAFGTAYALAFEAAYQAADGDTEADRRFIASMSVDVARVRFIADAAAAEAAS